MENPNWLYNLAKVSVRVNSDVYEGTVQKVTPSGLQALVLYNGDVHRFHRDGKGKFRIRGAYLAQPIPEGTRLCPEF